MNSCKNFKTAVGFFALILGFLFLSGCAAKSVNVWGDPETGLILKYRMPEGEVLNYLTSSETLQSMDVMGQIVDAEIQSSTAFSLQGIGKKEDNLRLQVTIASIDMSIVSSQGEMNPDTSPVEGKSFEMVLSPLGEELELIGADAIEFDLESEGTQNVESGFQTIFPNLSPNPVKLGDTWPSQDSIVEESDTGVMRIQSENVHTLDGFETVDGKECVRVKSEFKGKMDGEGNQQGMGLDYAGDVEGTDTWYFAYKEGLFVKMVSSIKVEGVITVEGQGLEIPFTREMKIEVGLSKKD